MTAATGDYAVDVAYPDHFHRETMPLWLHAVAAAAGFAAPDPSRPYRWCELGCGGGMNVLLAAASNPIGHFTGVDIDASAIARARTLAERAGLANVRFVALDLRDQDGLDAAETFDYIVSHGVWSWVGDDVREGMLGLIQRWLAPGGMVHLGYMTHPGASPLMAVARLMQEYARHLAGDAAARARAALAFVRRTAEAGSGLFAEHPALLGQLDAMERQDPAYLAHEFLGGHWQPQHVADTLARLASVDCGYIGSATPIENIDALSVPGDARPLLQPLSTPSLAETFKDLARNQSLRRDLYQRGAAPLPPERHLQRLDAVRFGLVPGTPSHAPQALDTRIGPVPCPPALFGPVLEALSACSRTFAELRALAPYRDAPGLLNQVMQTLLWAGLAHPLREDTGTGSAGALDALLRQPATIIGRGHWQCAPEFGSARATAQA